MSYFIFSSFIGALASGNFFSAFLKMCLLGADGTGPDVRQVYFNGTGRRAVAEEVGGGGGREFG